MGKESELSDLPIIYPRLQGPRMEELGQESWFPDFPSIILYLTKLCHAVCRTLSNTPLQALQGSRELFCYFLKKKHSSG